MLRHGALLALGVAILISFLAAGASPAARPQTVPVVPSLEPKATEALWQRLVTRPRGRAQSQDCRPLRGVFYAATDWLRLATKLAASASPCAEYYVSIPPIVGNKTNLRPDQARRIRALGPNFHALAEIHWTTWSRWVADNGKTWYDAGIEFRRRMAETGFDVAAGDTWAINEFPSGVRSGTGTARASARALVRGLYEGDGGRPARGVVFVVGVGQGTSPVSVYQTLVQNWLADVAFWTDMSAYVSDWSQEVYGDVRRYAVPGTPITLRRNYLNDYLQHALVVARAGPPTVGIARGFLDGAFSPLANAAWQYESGYGWTMVPFDQMQAFVSAQTYALRWFSVALGRQLDRWGFGWQPRNASGLSASDFATQTGAVLDRLAAAIRDSGATSDPADPGSGACGPPGENLHCGGDLTGAGFTELWQSFRSWSEPVLAFSTPDQTLTAGRASAPVGLSLIASSGTPQVAAAPMAVALTSSSQQGQFSRDPNGPWSSTLSVLIQAGSSSTPPFYYSDTRAATPQLSARAIGATTATQIMVVKAGEPAKLRLEPASASIRPYGSHTFAASATDAFGNPVSPASPQWTVKPARLGTVVAGSGSSATVTVGGRGGIGRLVATIAGEGGEVSTVSRLRVSPGAIRLTSIRYEPRGRVLRVTASLAEIRGEPARAVQTSVAVRRDSRWVFSGRKRTDATGRTTYLVPLRDGCYSTSVTGVNAPGYRWNGKTPANRFCT